MSLQPNPSKKYIERSLVTENFRNCVKALNNEDLMWALLFISKKHHGTKKSVRGDKSVDIYENQIRAIARQEKFLEFIRGELTKRNIVNFALI